MKYTNRVVISKPEPNCEIALDVTTQRMESEAHLQRKAFPTKFSNVDVLIERVPAHENKRAAFPTLSVVLTLWYVIDWLLVRVWERNPDT